MTLWHTETSSRCLPSSFKSSSRDSLLSSRGSPWMREPLSSGLKLAVTLFIYLGFLRRFQHCTGHITTGSCKGRGNQYIQSVRVLYCKLPTNGKQLPAFPLEAMPGIEPRPQRWEARVLPLCHRGPKLAVTLRHLATGDSYTTLQYAFRVASLTINKFVPEVCDTITRAYRDQVMWCPTLPED